MLSHPRTPAFGRSVVGTRARRLVVSCHFAQAPCRPRAGRVTRGLSAPIGRTRKSRTQLRKSGLPGTTSACRRFCRSAGVVFLRRGRSSLEIPRTDVAHAQTRPGAAASSDSKVSRTVATPASNRALGRACNGRTRAAAPAPRSPLVPAIPSLNPRSARLTVASRTSAPLTIFIDIGRTSALAPKLLAPRTRDSERYPCRERGAGFLP
jgi:hypothetical protein